MAANSRHYADVHLWLLRVINSCNTPKQLITANKIFRLYQKKYTRRKYGDFMGDIYWDLECRIDSRWIEISV